MGKVRVYELARELEMDNRALIAFAEELGISGKTSHSNSLDPDEVEKIRRAYMKQQQDSSAPVESKTVATRVDYQTGEERTVVERRKGNIIRRRRRNDSQGVAQPAAEPAEAVDPTQDIVAADAVVVEPESTNGNGSAAAAVEPALEVAADTQAADDLFKEVPEQEPAPAEQEVAPEAAEPEPEEQQEATAPESTATEPAEEEADEKKKGPKILGKIDLPQPKPAASSSGGRRGARESGGGRRSGSGPAAPGFSPEIFVEEGEGDGKGGRGRGRGAKKKKKKSKRRELSVSDLVDYDNRGGRRGPRPTKRGDKSELDDDSRLSSTEITTPKASKRVVKMEEFVSVGDLAKQMSLKSSEVIQKLISFGVMATINQVVDLDTATIVAEEFGYQVESTSFDETTILEEIEDNPENLVERPPVVTVMGHVDHGKTSLLDAIRDTSVVKREHGGITQHIGAYNVVLPDQRRIGFIDTPGHAAFTSMRARGANVTDVVILVVAADDGVMPQTVEAIDHAKAAEVPIVVAVNKMDKQDANPDKVKQQLAERGLQPEDWGGDVMFYPVSALQGDGIKELLEGVLLVSEMKELTADPSRAASGTVIEARQEKGRGTVATVLVQTGTLRVGDIFVAGAVSGRVRSMMDHLGSALEEAGPSTPVEISGFTEVPNSGDDFTVVDSENKARQVADHRAEKIRTREQGALGGPISLEEFSRMAKEQAAAELNVIVKADVHGSLEAVKDSLAKAGTEKVQVKTIHGGVGAVSESDVQLAIASSAIIVGFNVRAEPRAMSEAESNGVDIRFYRVIYELVDDVRGAMAGLLAPIEREKSLGRAEVRETFTVPKIGTIAGSYIQDGMIKRGVFLRLLRDNKVIYEGKLGSLRRFKDDVKEVQSGYECGIGIEGYGDVKPGDIIEAYEIEEIAATLD